MTAALIVEHAGKVFVVSATNHFSNEVQRAMETLFDNVEFDPEDEAVALSGLKNVWCSTPSIDDDFALVNIVDVQDDDVNLVTVLMIFAGGTYVSQHTSQSSLDEPIDVDRFIDWTVMDPKPPVQQFVTHSVSYPLANVKKLDGTVGGTPATMVLVPTVA